MDIITYLQGLCDSIFKLLPLKESEIESGERVYIKEFMNSLIINMKGAIDTFPELAVQKQYVFVINKINYLIYNDVDFYTWRKTVLDATRDIHNLREYFICEGKNE